MSGSDCIPPHMISDIAKRMSGAPLMEPILIETDGAKKTANILVVRAGDGFAHYLAARDDSDVGMDKMMKTVMKLEKDVAKAAPMAPADDPLRGFGIFQDILPRYCEGPVDVETSMYF